MNVDEESVQVRLDGVCELVRDVLGERIERVPETALPDELECGAPHPVEDVELLRAVVHPRRDCVFELRIVCERTRTTKCCVATRALLPSG